MPVRHFGQDLFALLLCPAFISQTVVGPEAQKPERWEEWRFLSKSY